MTSQKHTILYGRLSQDDGKNAESNSITNQRLMLEKYARDNGFDNVLFLADDGYTGTNFERPSWKQIEEMIKRGEVETLIVKDLSRLGREYLQVGYYLELFFPNMGIRFIAINDGVDSLVEGSNDFSPIRNWANELHAKDSSKKVRAVKKLQAERGERRRQTCLRLQKGGQGKQGDHPRRRSRSSGTENILAMCLRQRPQSDRPYSS